MLASLAGIESVEKPDPEIARVLLEMGDLPLPFGIGHRPRTHGRYGVDVVDDHKSCRRVLDAASSPTQAREGLEARIPVEDGSIDVDDNLRVSLNPTDHVRIDDLAMERP